MRFMEDLYIKETLSLFLYSARKSTIPSKTHKKSQSTGKYFILENNKKSKKFQKRLSGTMLDAAGILSNLKFSTAKLNIEFISMLLFN